MSLRDAESLRELEPKLTSLKWLMAYTSLKSERQKSNLLRNKLKIYEKESGATKKAPAFFSFILFTNI